jgi:predicted MFS family arabinose efflux permease
MHSIASSAGLRRLFATSIIARLPLAMLSIGLLVHAQHLTGSFAAAGVITSVYAIALGVGGPLLGQLVDRRGQTRVLLASATVAAALLVAIAVQPVGTSLAVLVALAAGIGLSEPPVGACLRTQLPALLSDPSAVRAGYALEASVVELTFIFGPPLALCIGALWSTGAALAAGGIVLLVATAAFAAQPASRSWRPAPAQRRPGGSLRTPAMRTLVIVLIAVGVLLGADEVAVVAAAKMLDSTAAAAPLLALWGVGSFVGGLLAARLGGGARTAAGFVLVLGALTAGHLALIPAAGSVVALGGVLLLAGAGIAPTEATIYAMVDDATPAATMTEAFAWLATAMAVGGAAGAASAGLLVDRAGPTAGFALAGGAGALAMLTTLLRSRTITPPRHSPESAAADTDWQLDHQASGPRPASDVAQPAFAVRSAAHDITGRLHDLARELTSPVDHATTSAQTTTSANPKETQWMPIRPPPRLRGRWQTHPGGLTRQPRPRSSGSRISGGW